MKAAVLWIKAASAGGVCVVLLCASFFSRTEAKEWSFKAGQVIVDTDKREVYGYVETDIDYTQEIQDAPIYYQDHTTFNLTVGPEALPAKKPLTERTTGRLRFAYPLREHYEVSQSRDASTELKLLGLMSGVNNASIFSGFSGTANYYQAKEFRTTMSMSGLTDSTIIYDCYFAAYVAPDGINLPLVAQLLRARYNHGYSVSYAWNYPYLTSAQNAAYRGNFAENLTYLALPEVKSANARYSCVGWLVREDSAAQASLLDVGLSGVESWKRFKRIQTERGNHQGQVESGQNKIANASENKIATASEIVR